MTQPPVSFSEKASNKDVGGYPVQISAKDLDANFVYATLEISDTSPQGNAQPFTVDEVTCSSGHTQRSLVFKPAAPSRDALFTVLGGGLLWLQAPESDLKQNLTAKNDQIEWSNAIQDGTQKGQMLKWDPDENNWVLFSGGAEGNFPQWDATDGWVDMGAGTVDGQLMKWNASTQNWVPGPSGTTDNELLRWNATDNTWEAFGRGSTDGQLLVAQSGGWVQFQAPPSSGTHVLGAVGGALQWIATEEC